MMHTTSHGAGFVHSTYPPMTKQATHRAQLDFATLGTFRSLSAARAAITRATTNRSTAK